MYHDFTKKFLLIFLSFSFIIIIVGCANTTDNKIAALESQNQMLQEQINNLASSPTPSPEPTYSDKEILAAQSATIVKDSLIDPSSFQINNIKYVRYESQIYGLLDQNQNIILIDYTANTRGGGINRETVSIRYDDNYNLFSAPDMWGAGYLITYTGDISNDNIKETIEFDIDVILKAMDLS